MKGGGGVGMGSEIGTRRTDSGNWVNIKAYVRLKED